MEKKLTKLKDFLLNIKTHNEEGALYLSGKGLCLSADCLIVNDEDFPDEVDGYYYYLFVDQIKDVSDNLFFQKNDYSVAELVKAINFYFENDAFIELEK